MARFIRGAKSINKGERIPLSRFDTPITILRVTATPSEEDTSWVREAVRVGNFHAAYEPGEIKLVADEKQSDKELFLFLIHNTDVEAFEFNLSDYVIRGTEIYNVQGYRPLGGRRGYIQLNTRSWGHVKDDDFAFLNTDHDLIDVEPNAIVDGNGQPIEDGQGNQLTSGPTPNLFWDDPS